MIGSMRFVIVSLLTYASNLQPHDAAMLLFAAAVLVFGT